MEAIDTIPRSELETRWARVRHHLSQDLPAAQGVFVFSRTLIYWLSGHWGNGVFWLPLQGEPILMLRKGLERARVESPVRSMHGFRSYGQVPKILAEEGQTVPSQAGVDMGSISWAMGQGLAKRLESISFVSADLVLSKARAVKSEWELALMRLAGERHQRSLIQALPDRLQLGMSERDIAGLVWEEMFRLGHQGQVRMQAPGEELYLGVVAVGDSANYPTVSSGPVGYRGQHPGVPQMGYMGQIWQHEQLLILDTVFQLEGYHTDKTQVYVAAEPENIPTPAGKAHSLCQELYAWLVDNLRPGVKPSELYAHCLDTVREHGFEEGFMGLGQNQVGFIGHGIGIFVDDWPVLAPKFDTPLEANMVLALEPKIGLPGLGMVGVENTCVVTDRGGVSLTGPADDILCLA